MNSKTSNTAKGNHTEHIAYRFLVHAGYEIVTVNWVAKKAEIDLIARYGKFLVFVEVKSRKSSKHGDPATMLTKRKQRLLVSAATAYMNEINYDGDFRFDLITIVGYGEHDAVLEHYKEVFWPGMDF